MSSLSNLLGRLFTVRSEEYKAFGWANGLMFLILSSQILFANFADTAFIKRFGVEYLPEMFVIDAVFVFFAMDLVRALVTKYSPMGLLTRILVIFATIEILCRFLIILDFSLLYPLMYLLRLQIDGVILIIFWNICNDLFDTRQAKRIFPLITAGGILGRVLGSFSTDFLTRVTNINNLLLVSAGLLFLAAMASQQVGRLFPSPMAAPKTRASEKKGWSSPIAGVKEMSILAKGSLLFMLLAAIRVLPNVVGPMFDYQFSVILAYTFPSEEALAQFLGTFRGVLNVITFVVLMFVGKVHTRVGIPNALLFRPSNYFLVFSLLLFRFDIVLGVYGRISIGVLTTTLHNPANNIMVNLFPDEFRAKIRPFLQMVSRAGSLLGSLMLLGLKAFIHASYFSIFGLLFVAPWILVTFRLKRNYSQFLLESLLDKQVNLKELEDVDLTVLVQDKKTLDRLLRGLSEEKGEAATLCARILSEARYPKLGEAILSVIREKDLQVKVDLFNLLRPEEARPIVPRLVEMAETAPPWLLVHLVGAVGRLAPGENTEFLKGASQSDQRAVQAEAVVGLYQTEMAEEGYSLLSRWLKSDNPEDLLHAVTTVGRTREVRLASHLDRVLGKENDPGIQARALEAYGWLEVPERNARILPWLESPRPEVRRAAVSALDLNVEEARERAIEMLGDESPDVRAAAHTRITEIGKDAVSSLLKGLTSPKKALKEGILHLLESLEVKDVEFSEFLTREIRSAYENIRAMRDLRTLEQTPALGLLIRHLEDKNDDAVFTVFRILEVEGEAAKVRTIYRGLRGAARDKANALEALEDTLHSALSRVLIPLLDDISPEEKLKVAQNEFAMSDERSSDPLAVLAGFLESDDPTTQTCALYAIGDHKMKGLSEKLQSFEAHPDRTVQETAKQAIDRTTGAKHRKPRKPISSTMDKVPHLMKADIFSDLQVRELIAISSVTGEKECPKDEILVREGEPGDTMFVIISGEVSIIQNHGTPHETLINTIAEGDCFGEMALFEDKPRANTVKANTDAKFLVLGKREFEETMRAYPRIPINICRVLSQRIRTSNVKFLD